MTVPEPLNGAERFDEARARVRDAYTNAINDIMDRVLEEFVMVDDRVEVLRDAAKFTAFILIVKMMEQRMMGLTWPLALRDWRELEKEMHREIPSMLLDFVNAAKASPQPEGANQ